MTIKDQQHHYTIILELSVHPSDLLFKCLQIGMQKEKDNDQDQTIEKFQEKIKRHIFKLNNYLLNHVDSFNNYLFFLLILIETLQILWFSIHSSFKYLDDSLGMYYLQQALRCLSLEYYMRSNPGSWQFCIILVFILTLFHLLSLSVTCYLVHQENISETAEMFAKVTNVQIILMNTVLTGPIFGVVATTLYCDNAADYHLGEVCYTVSEIPYYIMAVVVGVSLILQGFMYSLLYYNKNPFNRSCLGTPTNFSYLGKFWIKVLPPLYFLIDPALTYLNVYIFAYVIVLGGYLFLFRMFTPHTYSPQFFYFQHVCEVSLIWLGLVNIMQYYVSLKGEPNLCLVYSLLGILPVGYTFVRIEAESKKKIFLEGIRNIKKNKQVAEEFVIMVIQLVDSAETQKKTQLLGFIKMHSANCEETKCNCRELLTQLYTKKKQTPEELQHAFHQFLKNLLLEYIRKFSGMSVFKIVYSYLIYLKLESKILGIHYVTEAGKEKLSISEEFLIYRLKLLFEEESKEKENELAQDRGRSIKVYLQFNSLFLALETQIGNCAKNNLEYWRQLTEDFPSVLKLWNLAKHFQIQTQNSESLYTRISEIYPNNITTLVLYSSFLKCIVMNQKEYLKLTDKIKAEKLTTNVTIKDANEMKFRKNSNLCIITISTCTSNMGLILNSNTDLQRLLGYSKSEVVGQKVTKLMPKVYYDIHDGFINRYINRTDKDIDCSELSVFALCKKGFLVECNMLVKLIPQIEDGFHLVAFMKKVEETGSYDPHYLMYDGDTLNVEAINETCAGSLGIDSQNVRKSGDSISQISVHYLFPEMDFEELENKQELKTEGIETVIDTRAISEEFKAFETYEENSSDGGKNISKMNAKVFLVKENTYGKLKLRFLKFFLTVEEEASKESKNQLESRQLSSQNECKDQDDTQEVDGDYSKKYASFISKKSTKFLLILLAVGVYTFLAMEIGLVSFDVAENINNSNEVIQSLQVSNQSTTLMICLSNINYDIQRIHSTYALNLTSELFNRQQTHMSNSIAYLQQTLVDMIRMLVVLEDSVGYILPQSFDDYSFYNSQGPPIKQSFKYNDAMFQYITMAIFLAETELDSYNASSIANIEVVKNLFFVEQNGLTIFWKRTLDHLLSLQGYFQSRFTNYLQRRQVLLGLRIISVMIIFCLILPGIIQLNRINHNLLAIYQTIPIEDIRVMQQNSEQFLLANFEDISTQAKNQSSIRMHESSSNLQIESHHPHDRRDLGLHSILNTSRHDPQPSSFRPAESSDVLLVSMDEEHVPIKRDEVLNSIEMMESKRKVPKVRLSQIPSSTHSIVFLSVIIVFLLGCCVGEYYIHNHLFMPFVQFEKSVALYGKVTNLQRQILTYSQEFMINNIYLDNLNAGMRMLYEDIQTLYDLYPDVNKNREAIFGSLQELKRLIQIPGVNTLMSPQYTTVESSIQSVQIKLNSESIAFTAKCTQYILGTFQKISYIKFIVELVVVAILLRVLLMGFLQKVKTRTRRSTSMAMMIPLAIITKTPEILAML